MGSPEDGQEGERVQPTPSGSAAALVALAALQRNHLTEVQSATQCGISMGVDVGKRELAAIKGDAQRIIDDLERASARTPARDAAAQIEELQATLRDCQESLRQLLEEITAAEERLGAQGHESADADGGDTAV